MNKPTFAMRSFWIALVALSMFTATFAPETVLGKSTGFGLVWAAVFLIAIRKALADFFSQDETKPDPLDGNKRISTGRVQKPSDDFTERYIITLCSIALLVSLWKFDGYMLTNLLIWAAASTIAAVATKRADAHLECELSSTQINVFYAVPVVVSVALFGAYLSGVSIWFVIGFAVITAGAHMRYGFVLDRIEKDARNNVVQIRQPQSA